MRRMLLFLLVFTSQGAQAQPIDQLAMLNRCYAHLTGLPLPIEHPFRDAVNTGDPALPLCDELIDAAVLNSRTSRVTDAEGQAVLRNFYEFHRGWFENAVFEQMQGINVRHIDGTYDNFDSTEPALALTFAMFSEDQPYENVLRGDQGFFALRQVTPEINVRSAYPDVHLASRRQIRDRRYEDSVLPQISVKIPGVRFQRSGGPTSYVLNPRPVTIGELIGVQSDDRSLVLQNYSPSTARHILPFDRNALYTESAVDTADLRSTVDLFRNQGGGIIGLNTFIMLNWGHEVGRLQNGADKMARRWPQAVFKSLMCRDLPVLRQSDVDEYVVREPSIRTAPFRTSSTCVTCHATTDQFAAVARNLFLANSEVDYGGGLNPENGKGGKVTQLIAKFDSSQEDIGWPSETSSDYHRQEAAGVLMFRSTSGALVRRNVSSLEEIGTILSEQPDFYECAARRYFEHFTGIRIDFFDPGDPANFPTLNQESFETKTTRALLRSLANDLSEHQSTRVLLKAIIRTDFYRDQNFLQGK
ncbi:MAG: hypothetical protein AAF654_00375 [Myxococcota bacterium]